MEDAAANEATTKTRGKKRRGSSRGRGVVVEVRRRPDTGKWQARWLDPDTKKRVAISLSKLGISNKGQAEDWARDKEVELEAIRRETEVQGRRRQIATGWSAILAEYADSWEAENGKPLTQGYFARFRAFIDTHRITQGGDLREEHLHAFRTYLSKPWEGRAALAPASRNRHMNTVRAMLNWANRRKMIRVSRDAISDCLKSFKTDSKLPVVLERKEIERLLRACVEYDGARHHASRSDKGAYWTGQPSDSASSKWAPLGPYVLLMLLTGARPSEALELEWSAVKEHSILIFGSKTRRERRVPFGDSPALRQLIAGLRLRSKGQRYVLGDSPSGGPPNYHFRQWNRLLELAGLPGFQRKSLRSTCVSNVAAKSHLTESELGFRFGRGKDVSIKHYRIQLSPEDRKANTVEAWLEVEDAVWDCLRGLGLSAKLTKTKSDSAG